MVHNLSGFVVELALQVREAFVVRFDDKGVVEEVDRVGQMSKHGSDINRR
jgi:hypothetical protein